MAKCVVCGNEVDKLKSCPLCGNQQICLRCCFAISSGQPDRLAQIKHLFGVTKDEALSACESCLSGASPKE